MSVPRPARVLLAPALMAVLAACSNSPCGEAPAPAPQRAGDPLLDPSSPAVKEIPPDSFDVRLETSEGPIVVRVVRDWAPLGVYRFYNLARHGFYDGSRFFRVLPGFAAQFGMSGRPALDSVWAAQPLPDDPPRQRNVAGTLAYAKAGPDTRTTQLFFNYRDNEVLDQQGFAPIGRVIEGMGALYRLNGEYGETQPQGRGPAFACILSHGNAYLARRYPALDSIERATITPAPGL